MAFESVKENGVIWNPCYTGKKKEGTLKQLDINDKSYLIGHLIGTRVISGGTNGDSTIHTIKLDEVGDEDHLAEKVAKGDEVKVWGTNVLNDQMSQVIPGQFIKITLTGKVTSKISGNPYYTWDVGVDKTVEVLSGAATFSADTTPTKSVESAVKAESVESFENEGNDDLPF